MDIKPDELEFLEIVAIVRAWVLDLPEIPPISYDDLRHIRKYGPQITIGAKPKAKSRKKRRKLKKNAGSLTNHPQPTPKAGSHSILPLPTENAESPTILPQLKAKTAIHSFQDKPAWWNDEIARLRQIYMAARNKYTHFRRTKRRAEDADEIEAELCKAYKTAKFMKSDAIKRAKELISEEPLESLSADINDKLQITPRDSSGHPKSSNEVPLENGECSKPSR